MSDRDVRLISAGSLPMKGALLGPAGTFADTRICSNVVLVRGGGRTILIDTAAGSLDSEWEGATSNLAAALEAHGCTPSDVDTVVLTHLDFDHCGGAPEVPAERVFVTATAAAWARALPADRPARRVLEAIGDRVEEAADGAEVAPGVRMVEAPGHRGGHACVEIAVEESRRVFLADVIHHPSHVEHPEWDSEFDTDPELGLATRHRWLSELAGTGVLCAASHIEGWGTIEPAGGGYRWQPAG
jgi:glyoxylase-like metal-dependent hydrolase (beta-lactamase superfamily II)